MIFVFSKFLWKNKNSLKKTKIVSLKFQTFVWNFKFYFWKFNHFLKFQTKNLKIQTFSCTTRDWRPKESSVWFRCQVIYVQHWQQNKPSTQLLRALLGMLLMASLCHTRVSNIVRDKRLLQKCLYSYYQYERCFCAFCRLWKYFIIFLPKSWHFSAGIDRNWIVLLGRVLESKVSQV